MLKSLGCLASCFWDALTMGSVSTALEQWPLAEVGYTVETLIEGRNCMESRRGKSGAAGLVSSHKQ